jgi:hypothetical protein
MTDLLNKQKVGQHINNMEKFSQPVLFDGIGKGQFRPTDYDGVLEIDNKFWFAFEVKQKGKEMPYGQSLSYTRTADKWNQCGDKAVVFVVEHEELDPSKPIMLKDCVVAKYYTNKKWIVSKNRPTVAQLIQMIAERYNIDKLRK